MDDTPSLIVRTTAPFNAEPTLATLRRSRLTPQDAFYVRSHGDVPCLDRATYRVTLDGAVATPLALSLDDLATRFETVTVRAALQCAGNRRADLQPVRPTLGDPWEPGAIGNADWTGVRLADVLRAAGIGDGPGAGYVAFEAHDACDVAGGGCRYGVSIPRGKAMAPETLLCWAMNGEALTPHHGFPLRLVVPGYAGVRSPKWLASITVQREPSDNHFQARDYKIFPPSVTEETADWR